jgi:hypothetical protein
VAGVVGFMLLLRRLSCSVSPRVPGEHRGPGEITLYVEGRLHRRRLLTNHPIVGRSSKEVALRLDNCATKLRETGGLHTQGQTCVLTGLR